MRTKNVKPYTFGSLYKQDDPDGKIIPLAAGNLIDFTIAGPYQNTRPDIAANHNYSLQVRCLSNYSRCICHARRRTIVLYLTSTSVLMVLNHLLVLPSMRLA